MRYALRLKLLFTQLIVVVVWTVILTVAGEKNAVDDGNIMQMSGERGLLWSIGGRWLIVG